MKMKKFLIKINVKKLNKITFNNNLSNNRKMKKLKS